MAQESPAKRAESAPDARVNLVTKYLGKGVRIVVLGHLILVAALGIYAAETGARVFRYMGF